MEQAYNIVLDFNPSHVKVQCIRDDHKRNVTEQRLPDCWFSDSHYKRAKKKGVPCGESGKNINHSSIEGRLKKDEVYYQRLLQEGHTLQISA